MTPVDIPVTRPRYVRRICLQTVLPRTPDRRHLSQGVPFRKDSGRSEDSNTPYRTTVELQLSLNTRSAYPQMDSLDRDE